MGPNNITGFELWLMVWCTPQRKKKNTEVISFYIAYCENITTYELAN